MGNLFIHKSDKERLDKLNEQVRNSYGRANAELFKWLSEPKEDRVTTLIQSLKFTTVILPKPN